MSDREVMQQALDALNLPSLKTQQMLQQRDEAIATLRAQLEQPEQVSHAHEWFRTGAMEPGKMRCIHCGAWGNDASLTTSPQQQAEPVAWIVDGGKKSGQLLYTHEYELELVAPKIMCKPLYTHPTQRKPLTDEQIDEMWSDVHNDTSTLSLVKVFARAIEQAHGIKETP